MSVQGIRMGKAYVELGTDASKMQAGLRDAKAQLESFSRDAMRAGTAMGAAGAAILAPLAASVMQFAKSGDELDKMSKRTTVSVESLGELQYAAERSGQSLGVIESGLRRLTTVMQDAERGSTKYQDALAAAGVSMSDLAGLPLDQRMQKIAEGLSRVSDEGRRVALASEIFGRSAGGAILSMASDMATLRGEAQELGVVMSKDQAKAAADFNDAMLDLQRTVASVGREVATALLPALEDTIRQVRPVVKAFAEWVGENPKLIQTLAGIGVALTVGGGALVSFGLAAKGAAAALAGLASSAKIAGVALGAVKAPLVAIPAAIAAYAYGMHALTNALIEMGDPIKYNANQLALMNDELERTNKNLEAIGTGGALEFAKNQIEAMGMGVQEGIDHYRHMTEQSQRAMESAQSELETRNFGKSGERSRRDYEEVRLRLENARALNRESAESLAALEQYQTQQKAIAEAEAAAATARRQAHAEEVAAAQEAERVEVAAMQRQMDSLRERGQEAGVRRNLESSLGAASDRLSLARAGGGLDPAEEKRMLAEIYSARKALIEQREAEIKAESLRAIRAFEETGEYDKEAEFAREEALSQNAMALRNLTSAHQAELASIDADIEARKQATASAEKMLAIRQMEAERDVERAGGTITAEKEREYARRIFEARLAAAEGDASAELDARREFALQMLGMQAGAMDDAPGRRDVSGGFSVRAQAFARDRDQDALKKANQETANNTRDIRDVLVEAGAGIVLE